MLSQKQDQYYEVQDQARLTGTKTKTKTVMVQTWPKNSVFIYLLTKCPDVSAKINTFP